MTDTPFKPEHALPGRNADMTRSRAVLLALGILGANATPAAAQSFPSRTITIVSPAPAGRVTRTIRRAPGQRVSTKMSQQAGGEHKPRAHNTTSPPYHIP